MIYTPEQLEKMSDGEIHQAVAEKLDNGLTPDELGRMTQCKFDSKGRHYTIEFCPCDRWSDAMAIAIEYGISLETINRYSSVRAVVYDEELGSDTVLDDNGEIMHFLEASHENERRAICEVFLKMDI